MKPTANTDEQTAFEGFGVTVAIIAVMTFAATGLHIFGPLPFGNALGLAIVVTLCILTLKEVCWR